MTVKSIGTLTRILAVAVALLFSEPTFVHAGTQIFYDNFDDYATDSMPTSWTVIEGASPALLRVVEPGRLGDGKMVHLVYESGAGVTSMHTGLDGQTDVFSVEFWFKYDYLHAVEDRSCGFEFFGDPSDTMGPWFIYVSDTVQGQFKAYSGGWLDFGSLAPQTWGHLKIVVDPAAETYDVYIDDSLELNDGPFRDSPTNLQRFGFNASYFGVLAADYYIDDVNIYTGTEAPPPPGESAVLRWQLYD